MMTRITAGEQRVRVWLDRTDCWYWQADGDRPYGGYATMAQAIERAQQMLGADVRIVRHTDGQ